MGWAEKFDALNVAVARRIALLAVLGMLVLAAATSADILLRAVIRAPIQGFLEISALLLAITLAACFPAGLAERRHVSIDILQPFMGRRLSAALRTVGAITLLGFIVLLCWRMATFAVQAEQRNEVTGVLSVATWPFWWIVVAFLLLAVGSQLWIVIARFARRGEPDDSARRHWLGTSASRGINYLILLSFAVLSLWLLTSERGAALTAFPGGKIGLAILFFFMSWVLTLQLIPLGAVLGLIGVIGSAAIVGLAPALNGFGTQSADLFRNVNIATIPLFLMMGSFASAAGIGADVYRLAYALTGHLRGGLAAATIGGCAAFGAVTGSSMATTATVGRIAFPEMRRRRYADELSVGSLAAGGTLGALVPPSGVMVLYAILTELSIGHMFIAALVPAMLAVVGYLLAVAWFVYRRPGSAPAGPRAETAEIRRALTGCWAAVLLFGLVVGGLYWGVFTATEAASVGAASAFLIALFRGRLSGPAFWRVMGETAGVTAMIYLLIVGGMTFSFFTGLTQLPDAMVGFIESLGWPPLAIVLILLAIYVLLGTVMDPFAIMVVTIPVVTPLIVGFGYNPIWWGIINVIVVEIGQITPPVGLNLFVMKGIAPDVSLDTVYRGVWPFAVSAILKLLLLVFVPGLVLWLPGTMG